MLKVKKMKLIEEEWNCNFKNIPNTKRIDLKGTIRMKLKWISMHKIKS